MLFFHSVNDKNFKKNREQVPDIGTGTIGSITGSQIQRTDVIGSNSFILGIAGFGFGTGSENFNQVLAFAYP